MRKHPIIILSFVIAVGALVGGLWPSTSPVSTGQLVIPPAVVGAPVAFPKDFGAQLQAVREALVEIEQSTARTQERILESEATLRKQERMLSEIDRTETDFDAGKLSPQEYLREKENLARELKDDAA